MSGIGEEDQPKKTRFKPADSARFQNGGGTMNTANLHYLRPRACSAATAVTFTLLSIFGCADARGPATVSTDREIMIEASPSSRVVLTFWRLRHKQFVLSPDAIGGLNRILHSTVAVCGPHTERGFPFASFKTDDKVFYWRGDRIAYDLENGEGQALEWFQDPCVAAMAAHLGLFDDSFEQRIPGALSLLERYGRGETIDRRREGGVHATSGPNLPGPLK